MREAINSAARPEGVEQGVYLGGFYADCAFRQAVPKLFLHLSVEFSQRAFGLPKGIQKFTCTSKKPERNIQMKVFLTPRKEMEIS